MTEIVMEEMEKAAQPTQQHCPQAGCIRPFPHEGMRHRYAETKDLKKEPEVTVPEPDERPFAGSIEDRPRNHAISIVDNGLQVAWDTCARCLHHITTCSCATGPLEPEYITRWRNKDFPLADEPEVDVVALAKQVAEDARDAIVGPSDDEPDEPDDVDDNDVMVPVEATGQDDDIDPEVGF